MFAAAPTPPEMPIRIVARTDVPHSPPRTMPPVLCSNCHLRSLCIPAGLAAADVERLEKLLYGRRRLKTGEPLFRQGAPFQFVYAVRSGSFKSTVTLRDGREQVVGFPIAGEMVGMDGMSDGVHPTAAAALEDAEVCAIPQANLQQAAAESRVVERVLATLLGREIVRDHLLMAQLGTMNAEERLAAFLVNMSQRMKARGYSPVEFELRMSRSEIGSYLGMTVETVSRTLAAFQQQGLLRVQKKSVRIIDLGILVRIVDSGFR
jgi:CRP/FNR family transcriptional regulator